MTEKIKCECGALVTISNLKRHQNTTKHLNDLEFIKQEKNKNYQCECKHFYTKKNKKRHDNSKHHIDYLKHNKQYKINGQLLTLEQIANKSHEEIFNILNGKS